MSLRSTEVLQQKLGHLGHFGLSSFGTKGSNQDTHPTVMRQPVGWLPNQHSPGRSTKFSSYSGTAQVPLLFDHGLLVEEAHFNELFKANSFSPPDGHSILALLYPSVEATCRLCTARQCRVQSITCPHPTGAQGSATMQVAPSHKPAVAGILPASTTVKLDGNKCLALFNQLARKGQRKAVERARANEPGGALGHWILIHLAGSEYQGWLGYE